VATIPVIKQISPIKGKSMADKSSDRSLAAKKAAATRKHRAAGKKAAKTRKRRDAARKAAETRRARQN
jgi:hypothetical protein